jgi:hypothetical protein
MSAARANTSTLLRERTDRAELPCRKWQRRPRHDIAVAESHRKARPIGREIAKTVDRPVRALAADLLQKLQAASISIRIYRHIGNPLLSIAHRGELRLRQPSPTQAYLSVAGILDDLSHNQPCCNPAPLCFKANAAPDTFPLSSCPMLREWSRSDEAPVTACWHFGPMSCEQGSSSNKAAVTSRVPIRRRG